MKETPLVKEIQLELSHGDTRLWRNNVGEAWAGQAHSSRGGGIIIPAPQRINFGLCVGSSDLIGLHSVVVTPSMIGMTVAIFCAVEVKVKRKAHERRAQEDYIGLVSKLGGRAGFATRIEEAIEVVEGYGKG